MSLSTEGTPPYGTYSQERSGTVRCVSDRKFFPGLLIACLVSCDTSQSVTLLLEEPAIPSYPQEHEERIKKQGCSKIVLEIVSEIA